MEATYQRIDRTANGRGGLAAWTERVVVLLLVAGIAIAAAIVFLVATGAVDAGTIVADDVLRERLLGFAAGARGVDAAILAAGAAIVAVGALYVAARRIAPGARVAQAAGNHILSADENGVIAVDSQGISTIAEASILRGARVLDVNVTVRGRGSAPVRLKVEALVHGGADLSAVGKEVRDSARHAVETLAGLDVADVVVRLDVLPPEALERELL